MEEKSKIKSAVKMIIMMTRFSVVFSIMICVVTVIIIYQAINLSNHEIMRAESRNRAFVGEYDLYPSEGIDYKLEARIVGEDTENAWYHELIAAEYGDIIEVRLKVIATNPDDINQTELRYQTFYACSAGLELVEAAVDHEHLILPGGSLADYPEDIEDEHVTYIAVGTFEFTSKDWWSGKSSSVIIPHNTDMFTKLEVIAPYCDVDIMVIITLIVAVVLFGVVIPLVFKRETYYLLEDFEDTEGTE